MSRKMFKKLYRDHYRKMGVPWTLGWWAYQRNKQANESLFFWMER